MQPSQLYTILEDPVVPKTMRSYSMSSTTSLSSAASTGSRTAEDLLDRLVAQSTSTHIHLWAAGNVRLGSLDLTTSSAETAELVRAMQVDPRFEVIAVRHLDDDGEDWKVTFRRTETLPHSP
ncbi:hypothetical protein M231_06159 [Tremella mesenterica]|uniref:Uncharacterized protein n=1 Tax=Tremella mesenterica TaxID=5217 RepID=A0A4Q1BCP8_TREME|nr:hypothetical protein M231_06159 [Tremella mesenterica]